MGFSPKFSVRNQGVMHMGGERETVVDQQASKKSTETHILNNKIRFHESNKEVHFHDDQRNLKVAVPSGAWYAAWEKLSTGQVKKYSYIDPVNKTNLKVRIKSGKSKEIFDAEIIIKSVAFAPSFAALEKFTKGA